MKTLSLFLFASVLLLLSILAAVANAGWKSVGPGTALDVQSATMEVSSATNTVVKVGNAFLMGTVNGGVWRTTDPSTTIRPHWVNVFDSQPVTCSSMTSLHVSAFNPNTVYAACGASTSSQMGYYWNVRNTGDFAGFAVSTDAGLTWKMADFPPNYSVEDVVELPNGDVAAAVRGGFSDNQTVSTGGVWVSSNIFDRASWKKTSEVAAFNLRFDNVSKSLFASSAGVTADKALMVSADNGQSWTSASATLKFSDNMLPFYSCLALIPGEAIFLGVMLSPARYQAKGLGAGFGQVFIFNMTASKWSIVGGTPLSNQFRGDKKNEACSWNCTVPLSCCFGVDNDYSEKDRMGLFVIPGDNKFLYVSGNAGFLAYRVDYKNALDLPPCTLNVTSTAATCYSTPDNGVIDINLWTPMWNQGSPFPEDCVNNQTPHVDTRNWGYDSVTGNMFLVSDGGIFVREKPSMAGQGSWRGFSGDVTTFEYLHASYLPSEDRFVAAAQDNQVHISVKNAQQNPTAAARSWGGGDGTWTTIDAKSNPPRFFGSVQFADGLSYVPSDFAGAPQQSAVGIDLTKRGLDALATQNPRARASVLPFFETPYHVNRFNTDMLYMWANATLFNDHSTNNPGFFKLNISSPSNKQNATPVLSASDNIIDFIAGGMLDGKNTEDVIVGVSSTHVYTYYNGVNAKTALPVQFAEPLTEGVEDYCNYVDFIVPCTNNGAKKDMTWPNHLKTMSVAVHSQDAKVIAITGWPKLESNAGEEKIILSTDGGKTWDTELLGDLKTASGALSYARPFALAFVGENYLVAGTVNGNFVTDFTNKNANSGYMWKRIGDFTEFPRVITSYNNYYPEQDLLVTATMGRGVYFLINATDAVKKAVTTTAAPSNTQTSSPITQTTATSMVPSTPTPSSNNTNHGNGPSKGDAVKIALGVSIPLVLIIIGALWWWRKKSSGGTGSNSNTEYQQVGDRPDLHQA